MTESTRSAPAACPVAAGNHDSVEVQEDNDDADEVRHPTQRDETEREITEAAGDADRLANVHPGKE